MTDTGTLRRLFDPPPSTWGLRGDPLLWDEMAAACTAAPLDLDAEDAEQILRTAFATLTGVALDTAPDVLPVARFHRPTGMSAGLVSPPFWRDRALPLLLSRLEAADG